MQDVCIPFGRKDGTEDMMLKVTDICSTDTNDPSYCATPADIKVDRSKAVTMQHLGARPIETYPELMGDQFPKKKLGGSSLGVGQTYSYLFPFLLFQTQNTYHF